MNAKDAYKDFQRKSGKKGGKTTFKKYGRDHMIRIGKKGGRASAKKALSAKT